MKMTHTPYAGQNLKGTGLNIRTIYKEKYIFHNKSHRRLVAKAAWSNKMIDYIPLGEIEQISFEIWHANGQEDES